MNRRVFLLDGGWIALRNRGNNCVRVQRGTMTRRSLRTVSVDWDNGTLTGIDLPEEFVAHLHADWEDDHA